MVRSVASSGKFYRLPPDKENTADWTRDVFFTSQNSDRTGNHLTFGAKTGKLSFHIIFKMLKRFREAGLIG